MTTISDDFNRADESTLASPWINLATEGGGGVFKLVTNRVVPFSEDWDSEAGWDAAVNAIGADQFSEAAIYTTNTTGGAAGLGTLLRSNNVPNTGRNLYRIVADHASSGNVDIAKRIGGTYSLISSKTSSAWTDGDTIRTEIDGSTITVKITGNLVGTTTDTSIASGQPGIAYSSKAVNAAIDNWSGGDLESSTPQKLRPDADIGTTGWTTTPLWSKIDEDVADGTVISGVAS